jgi:hypothetical protein
MDEVNDFWVLRYSLIKEAQEVANSTHKCNTQQIIDIK